MNRTFKPEREKITILITWKLLSRSWQNFYRRYAPWLRLRGWSHGLPSQLWRSLFVIYVLDQGLYRGPNDILLHLGGQTPQKTEILRARIGLSSLNEKKNQILIIWKLLSRSLRNFYREYALRTTNEPSWVVSWLTPSRSKMAGAAIFNFVKMSITPDWIKMSAPNFMGRCTTAVRRWPRDQKSKPEVNSRDVIKWTSEA